MSTAINIVLSGILPVGIGIYLVLLAKGRIQPKDQAAQKKLEEWRTATQVIGWLSISAGALSIVFEFLELHGSWWITETGADGIGGWDGKTDSSERKKR